MSKERNDFFLNRKSGTRKLRIESRSIGYNLKDQAR